MSKRCGSSQRASERESQVQESKLIPIAYFTGRDLIALDVLSSKFLTRETLFISAATTTMTTLRPGSARLDSNCFQLIFDSSSSSSSSSSTNHNPICGELIRLFPLHFKNLPARVLSRHSIRSSERKTNQSQNSSSYGFWSVGRSVGQAGSR